jgi:hypothetical protein
MEWENDRIIWIRKKVVRAFSKLPSQPGRNEERHRHV